MRAILVGMLNIVAAIFRGDAPIMPEGTTVVEAGDEVFFIADTRNIRGVLR